MMTLHTLASGSEGNCLLISGGGTHILVDAGISARRIKTSLAQLGLRIEDISAILLTHEHSDHTCALATLIKHHATPLYASRGTASQLCYRLAGIERQLRVVERSGTFAVGACRVTVFPTSHDSRESVDYRVDCPDGSIGILTDTGYVTDEAADALTGVELLVLESNHDVDWLRSGPYPYYLKERILSLQGHLSNEDAARFAVMMAQRGTRQIVLAHLSRENNTPERALETVECALRAAELGTFVTVAPRGELSRCFELEGEACRK
ncbi:MAG: MBL fold metallo-hydrolase [Oscillospiraceae bacterium]|nr:MBL fold metallo-hydrolase [Oscillospiraceae bacterium]